MFYCCLFSLSCIVHAKQIKLSNIAHEFEYSRTWRVNPFWFARTINLSTWKVIIAIHSEKKRSSDTIKLHEENIIYEVDRLAPRETWRKSWYIILYIDWVRPLFNFSVFFHSLLSFLSRSLFRTSKQMNNKKLNLIEIKF